MVWACDAKRRMIGLRNVWSMKLRFPDQELDQRGPGETLWKRTVKQVNGTRRMLWIVVDGGSWYRMYDQDGHEWVNVSSDTDPPG